MTAAEAARMEANRQELLWDLLELRRLGLVQINQDDDGVTTFQLSPDGERKAAEFAWLLLRTRGRP
jgi:hypothetical protein